MYREQTEKLATLLSYLKETTPKTRELSLAVTKVEEALHWLQSPTISAPSTTLDEVLNSLPPSPTPDDVAAWKKTVADYRNSQNKTGGAK